MTKATLTAGLELEETNADVFGKTPKWTGAMAFTAIFGEGTTANKFDLAYMAERTVASNTNDDIDLAGVLSSALGDTITAAEIVAIMIINRQKDGTVNTTDLTIGNEGSNPWAGLLGAAGEVGPLKPGAVFLVAAGDAAGLGAVAAGTGDMLRVANSAGASNTYQICILARSS